MNAWLRRWRRWSRPGAALLLLGLAGCATARPVPRQSLRPPRSATLDEVLASYDRYCDGLRTLSASGDLDVRDFRAGKARRIGVRVVAGRGGRLYLKGSVAVVTALEVASDGARFWFEVPSKKTVWTGEAGAAASEDAGTEQAPYYVLRPRDLTAAFLPEPLAPGPGESVVLEADRQSFSLTLARLTGDRGVAARRVWLDRETLRPLRIRSYKASGDVASEFDLGDWRGDAPRQVTIKRPGDGYEASFSFSKVETNVTVPERAFVGRTPEGYKIVEVGSS